MVECQKRLRTGRFKQQPNFKKPPHTSKVALSKCTHPAFLTLPLGITRIETLGSTPRFDPPGGDPPWMTVVSFTAPSWPWWTAATSAWNLEGVIGILSLSVGMVSKRRRTGRLRTYQCAVNMTHRNGPAAPSGHRGSAAARITASILKAGEATRDFRTDRLVMHRCHKRIETHKGLNHQNRSHRLVVSATMINGDGFMQVIISIYVILYGYCNWWVDDG